MSSEQSLDPQLIEQTKRQIQSLVKEIAQLSKEDLAPDQYYSEFLTRVVSALAAVGGAVWTLNEEGRLGLQYQINLQKTQLGDNEEGQMQHSRLVYKMLTHDDGMLVPPHSGAGEDADDPAANPTDFLVVLGPLKTDLETVGVVEVFQRPDSGPSTQRGYLRFLMQMCELATDYLKSHQLRHFSDRQTLWTQLEGFTHTSHTSLDPRETAYTIANDGRRLIECDRLSVAIAKGRKCHVEAISGQDLFDKRSNIVRLLGRLASAVVATGEPVWYTGDTRDMAPQVEDAVQAYVDEAHSKTVAVLPLSKPELLEREHDDDYKPEAPFGALIVEQIEDSRVPETMRQRVDVVCRHSSTALGNSLEHNNLFLMPVWRAIGKASWVLRAKTLPKTILISAAVLAVIVILIAWPANFKMYSKGTLEPVVRRDVFAEIDGICDEVNVEHGDTVDVGQIVARISNTDLDVAVQDILGQRDETRERLNIIRIDLTSGSATVQETNRLRGELAGLLEKQRSLEAQWALYQKKMQDLDIRSPIDGQVVTWDLRHRLINRPLQRGQKLMEVADPRGAWQLELNMPEDQMGYIVESQKELYVKLRKRLRKEMQARTELTSDDLDAAVGAVSNADLSDKLREIMNDELREKMLAKLDKIAKRIRKPVATSEESVPPAGITEGEESGEGNGIADPSEEDALEDASAPEADEPQLDASSARTGTVGSARVTASSDVNEESLGPTLESESEEVIADAPPTEDSATEDSASDSLEEAEQTPDMSWLKNLAEEAAKSAAAFDPANEPKEDEPIENEPASAPETRLQQPGSDPVETVPDAPEEPELKPIPAPEFSTGAQPVDPSAAAPGSPSLDVPGVDPSGAVAPQAFAGSDAEAIEYVMAAEDYLEMRARLETLIATMPNSVMRTELRDTLDDGLSNRLPVVFHLATDPGTSYEGDVSEIHLSAEVRGDEGNTVLIKVAIDKEELPSLRPGASVNAKVFCGKRSLGFTLLHDPIDFIRSRVLFRYF